MKTLCVITLLSHYTAHVENKERRKLSASLILERQVWIIHTKMMDFYEAEQVQGKIMSQFFGIDSKAPYPDCVINNFVVK